MTRAMYRLIRPALFALDPERAHAASLRWLALRDRLRRPVPVPDPPNPWPLLATSVAGIAFRNPLGIAAGLDKDGRAIDGLLALGVGGVEIGTLTPQPQPGNPRPRVFRLPAERAMINRLGFNNGGLEAGLARATGSTRRAGSGALGINVGANKDSADRIADYRLGVARAAPLAAWVTINISSPNTPGLRDLQHGAALRELLAACTDARAGARADGRATPIFLKVAPDLDPATIDDIAQATIEAGVDALVIGNTTVSRPAIGGRHAAETGGLSGAPLAPLAMARLRDFRIATGGAVPLVAAGGIGSAEEAYARIRAGASLIQLYTALVYEGPALIGRMLSGLDGLLRRDGFTGLAQAVGSDAR
jgi:dihydroorotate dehydrogenase